MPSAGLSAEYEIFTHKGGFIGKYKSQSYLAWHEDPRMCDGVVLEIEGKGRVVCFLGEPYTLCSN